MQLLVLRQGIQVHEIDCQHGAIFVVELDSFTYAGGKTSLDRPWLIVCRELLQGGLHLEPSMSDCAEGSDSGVF